jgi:hypothetical protein
MFSGKSIFCNAHSAKASPSIFSTLLGNSIKRRFLQLLNIDSLIVFIPVSNSTGISTEDIMGALTYTKPDNGISNDFQKLTIEDKLSVSNYIEFLISRYKK